MAGTSFIVRSIDAYSPTKLIMSVEIDGAPAQDFVFQRDEFSRTHGLDRRALAIFRMRAAWLEAGEPSTLAALRTALVDKPMKV